MTRSYLLRRQKIRSDIHWQQLRSGRPNEPLNGATVRLGHPSTDHRKEEMVLIYLCGQGQVAGQRQRRREGRAKLGAGERLARSLLAITHSVPRTARGGHSPR